MNVLILDARMSKRMGSPVPKVVLSPAGCSMLGPVLDGAVGLSQFTSGVVKGNGAENVMVRCEGCMDVAFVLQSGQLGTGNLLREAPPEIDPSDPHMLVCFEDVLLLDRTMFERVVGATIGAGSTFTLKVQEGRITVSRPRQVTVEDWKRPLKKRYVHEETN